MGVDLHELLAAATRQDAGRTSRRARQLETHGEGLDPTHRSVLEGSHDPMQSAHLYQRNFGDSGMLKLGKIVYVQPYTHWYRVQCDDGDGDFPCARMTETGCLLFAVRDTSPLPVNSLVLVWKHPGASEGLILGAIPDKVFNGTLVYPDYISQGGGTGVKRERYYRSLYELTENEGGVSDYSNSRPVDSLASGEWGRMGDLGVGVVLDLFTLMLRASEDCGAWFSYLDRLTRIAGHNFDLRTSISEQIVRNDQGEGQHFFGVTPYPWELLGAFKQETKVYQEHSNIDVQYELPVGKFEPVHDDQQSFYRFQEHHGYLGQAYMREVIAPPSDSSGLLRYQDPKVLPGLFREQIGLTGAYGLTSAHSIAIVKRPIIPVAKRLKLAEDATGDTNTSYNPAGTFGDGPKHDPKDLSVAEDAKLPTLLKASAFMDAMAHLFNWQGIHAFAYHEQDFYLPEADEVRPFSAQQFVTSFITLRDQMWLPSPASKKITIDHRYGEVPYYETTAGLWLTPDGSVVIRDGYGSQILMSGGQIIQSAPGDIFRQSGRSCIDYAGHDVISRANNSVDITATNHDVHIKAEVNCELLAANGGVGRMLLENKAVGVTHNYKNLVGEEVEGSGILFKAENSQVAALGNQLYFRSLEQDITLDAAQGKGVIYSVSSDFVRHIERTAMDAFGVGKRKTSVNFFTAQNAQIQTSVQMGGPLTISKGGALINGSVDLVDGYIGSNQAEQYNFYVGDLKSIGLANAQKSLEDTRANMRTVRDTAEKNFTQGIADRLWAAQQIGNEDLISQLQFSLRLPGQYRTEDFLLPFNPWQQSLQANGGGKTWEEKVVKYQGRDLMPHPGIEKWQDEATWLNQESLLHDLTTGQDNSRASGVYESPKLKDWQKLKPQNNYLIT